MFASIVHFNATFFFYFVVWFGVCVCVLAIDTTKGDDWQRSAGFTCLVFSFPCADMDRFFFCVWQFKENDDDGMLSVCVNVHHFHSIDCVQIFPFSVEKDTCSFHTRHSYSIINFWMIKYAVCCLYVDSRRFTAYFIQVLSTRYFTCIRFTFLCSERWKWKFDSTQFHLFLFK